METSGPGPQRCGAGELERQQRNGRNRHMVILVFTGFMSVADR